MIDPGICTGSSVLLACSGYFLTFLFLRILLVLPSMLSMTLILSKYMVLEVALTCGANDYVDSSLCILFDVSIFSHSFS